MEFGDRLREARVNKGLTQEQLAKKIGVAKSTLAGYEKGNREPDVFKIKKIIEALGIDAEYLLDIKKSSPAQDELDEENASIILYKALISAGFLGPGEDLTPKQYEFLDALSVMLSAFFDR